MATASLERRRALILDRDGVVNADSGYLHRIEDCRFVEGIFALATAFSRRRFAIVVVTNQSGIGRGLYGEADFAELMSWMRGEFTREGIEIAGIYHCPDAPDTVPPSTWNGHRLRKPGPGMILKAAEELSLDLPRSWLVGDKLADIEAGRAAGIGSLVLYDASAPAAARQGDFWTVPRFADVEALLTAQEG
jgi:D-glycero-D-manno-heptose 1,7-bisphosphate phosphatase